MKIFVFTLLLAVLAGGSAHAQQRYPYRNCRHNNSKACQDARKAFAEHHNGIYPEQWFSENYQGQPGRWQWNNAEGDTWYQGLLGHWFQEREGPRFRADNGDEYRKGDKGWGWVTGRGNEGRDHGQGNQQHDHGTGHQNRGPGQGNQNR